MHNLDTKRVCRAVGVRACTRQRRPNSVRLAMDKKTKGGKGGRRERSRKKASFVTREGYQTLGRCAGEPEDLRCKPDRGGGDRGYVYLHKLGDWSLGILSKRIPYGDKTSAADAGRAGGVEGRGCKV